MRPILFTVIFSHPDCDTVVANEVPENEVHAVVLGASPVQRAVISPANYWDLDSEPSVIEARTPRFVEALKQPAGFSVTYHAWDQCDTPPWALNLIQQLDAEAFLARQARREEAASRKANSYYAVGERAKVVI